MSLWFLQLNLLAACLRFASAEDGPLPRSLVKLVESSPISSIEDLQLLLLTDSVVEDPDSYLARGPHANDTFGRFPRSLDAQPAQQALCKVRTEVLEVTRAMLDRRNANFLLWPPCVEVQRCSGCCNTRTLQCVPTVTHTRYLQVMKIEYFNMQPRYDKAIISIQDHVECRCQIVPQSPGPPKTTAKKTTPRRQSPKEPKVKGRSKGELHQQDELKQNQKLQLEEGATGSQLWPWKHATQTEAGVPGKHHANRLETQTSRTPLATLNHTQQQETEMTELLWRFELLKLYQEIGGRGLHKNDTNDTRKSLTEDKLLHNHTQQEVKHSGGQHHNFTKQPGTEESRHAGQIPSAPEPERETHRHGARTEPPPQVGSLEPGHEPAEETGEGRGDEPTESGAKRPTPEREEEKSELPRPHKKHQLHHPHHHHHHTPIHTTTQRPATAPPTTTRPPTTSAAPRTPARHSPPRRRQRKNRNRISKAVMRAMLM